MGSDLAVISIRSEDSASRSSPARPSNANSSPAKRVTIAELVSLPSSVPPTAKFECVAEIVALNDYYRWYFLACPGCNRKVRSTDDLSYCSSSECKLFDQVVETLQWYRVAVEATDGAAHIGFVLFGKVAEFAIGFGVSDVLSEVDASSYDPPAKLSALIGKRFLFGLSAGKCKKFLDHTEFVASRVGPVPPDATLPWLPCVQPGSSPAHPTSNLSALSSNPLSAPSSSHSSALYVPVCDPPGYSPSVPQVSDIAAGAGADPVTPSSDVYSVEANDSNAMHVLLLDFFVYCCICFEPNLS